MPVCEFQSRLSICWFSCCRLLHLLLRRSRIEIVYFEMKKFRNVTGWQKFTDHPTRRSSGSTDGAEGLAWILSAKISLLIVYLRPQSCITESFLALYHISGVRVLAFPCHLAPDFLKTAHSCSCCDSCCLTLTVRNMRRLIFCCCKNKMRELGWCSFVANYRISSIK